MGALLALDCEERVIQDLLRSVDPSAVPMDELVQEVETQNRLKVLLPFLEGALQAGSQDPAVHNGIAKVYIGRFPNFLCTTKTQKMLSGVRHTVSEDFANIARHCLWAAVGWRLPGGLPTFDRVISMPQNANCFFP